MTPHPSTMPEAKFRTVKKREKPVSSVRTSEFAAEVKARKLAAAAAPARSAAAISVTAMASAAVSAPATSGLAAVAEPATVPAAKSKKEDKSKFGLISFWPVAVGLFITGFAPQWQSIAMQAGVGILRFTFPFSLLAMHQEIGISGQMVTVLPQLALYAQLPIDGLLVMLSLARSKSLVTAIVQVTAIHVVCAFVLWLVETTAK